VDYQWDEHKARSNLQKHGIDFVDAVSVFEDEMAITIEDDYPEGERLVTIGMNAVGQILVVVYTYRGNIIRLISARRATSYECRHYEGRP
jgi:uncharacterized DUF497 family protein